MEVQFSTLDIVNVSWMLECISVQSVLPLAPRYMIYTSQKTKRIFEQTLDPFGDSYYDDCTVETLRDAINSVTNTSEKQFRQHEKDNPLSAECHVLRNREPSTTTTTFFPWDALSRRVFDLRILVCECEELCIPYARPDRSRSRVFPGDLKRQRCGSDSAALLSGNVSDDCGLLTVELASDGLRSPKRQRCDFLQDPPQISPKQRLAMIDFVVDGGCVARSLHEATHCVDRQGMLFRLQP
jgi:hypothetical protein